MFQARGQVLQVEPEMAKMVSGCHVFSCVVLSVIKYFSQWNLFVSEGVFTLSHFVLQGFHLSSRGPACCVARH